MKITYLAILAVLPLAACNTNATNPMAATMPMPMPANLSVSAQDQNFAMQAAGGDMFEIQSSQMALQKSHNPRILAFAQHMIDDHTNTTQQLMVLAPQKGITLPTSMDPTLQQKMSVLDAAGRTFDREYLSAQVNAHRTMAQAMQTEISGGTDPDLKAFAQNTLPVVQSHLQMAQRLRAR